MTTTMTFDSNGIPNLPERASKDDRAVAWTLAAGAAHSVLRAGLLLGSQARWCSERYTLAAAQDPEAANHTAIEYTKRKKTDPRGWSTPSYGLAVFIGGQIKHGHVHNMRVEGVVRMWTGGYISEETVHEILGSKAGLEKLYRESWNGGYDGLTGYGRNLEGVAAGMLAKAPRSGPLLVAKEGTFEDGDPNEKLHMVAALGEPHWGGMVTNIAETRPGQVATAPPAIRQGFNH